MFSGQQCGGGEKDWGSKHGLLVAKERAIWEICQVSGRWTCDVAFCRVPARYKAAKVSVKCVYASKNDALISGIITYMLDVVSRELFILSTGPLPSQRREAKASLIVVMDYTARWLANIWNNQALVI